MRSAELQIDFSGLSREMKWKHPPRVRFIYIKLKDNKKKSNRLKGKVQPN